MQPFVSNRSGLGLHNRRDLVTTATADLTFLISPFASDRHDQIEKPTQGLNQCNVLVDLSDSTYAVDSLESEALNNLTWEIHCHLQAASKDRSEVFLTFCDIEFDR